jgi:uncharacterized protein YbjQ (UPF0145 family)
MNMRVGSSKDMDARAVTLLGEISAASDWRAAAEGLDEGVFRLKALHKLMRVAEDCDADAVLDVDYREELLARSENPGSAPLRRVCATAVAVKLKSA